MHDHACSVKHKITVREKIVFGLKNVYAVIGVSLADKRASLANAANAYVFLPRSLRSVRLPFSGPSRDERLNGSHPPSRAEGREPSARTFSRR
jgi:hypothetical protein